MKVKLLVYLILVVIFTGCAQKTISPDKLKKIKNVGVVSIHGNKIESIERGLTIFGNEDVLTDISSWSIDKFVVDELKKQLELKKYNVKPIYLTQNQILEYDSSDDYKFRQRFLKKLIAKYNLDSLLVMVKGNYVPETHDYTRGIAIIKGKALGLENTHIKFNLYLEGPAIEKDKFIALHFNHIRFFKEIDNKLWVDTKKSVPQESLLKIENDVKGMLSSVIEENIKVIGY